MKTIAERVQRGIELLDERGPEDWRDKVDLEILDLRHGDSCVLGQIYGGYFAGCLALDLYPTGVKAAGLLHTVFHSEELIDQEYVDLTAGWIRELEPVAV